jgi:putative ATP-dependent endonuclease of OLD family
MKVRRITLKNFRGAVEGAVSFGAGHTLLLGSNNVGKSTVCEALDLVLGPERLARRPVIDEHDFFCGKYLDADGNPIEIQITVVLTELSKEAKTRFWRHLRAWDEKAGDYAEGEAAKEKDIDASWALPVTRRPPGIE